MCAGWWCVPKTLHLIITRYVGFICLKSAEIRLYPCWSQPLRPPLLFKIIYTHILMILKSCNACATTNDQHNTGVHDFKC